MATRLLAKGWALLVFDADGDAMEPLVALGAGRAASPKDLADRCDVVVACLPSPELLQAAMLGEDGVIHGRRARTVIDHSPSGPGVSAAVAAALAKASIAMVDAAVSGNPERASDGKLMLMVSGAPGAIEAVRAVLDTLSQRIVILGKTPGLGQVMKVVNHFLSATALAASAEAMVVGVKAGLDPRQMLEVLNNGSGRNSATLDKIPNNVLPGTFDHGFPIDPLYDDVRMFVEAAEALEVPTSVATSVRQLWLQSKLASGGDADVTRIFELIEGWSAKSVRAHGGT